MYQLRRNVLQLVVDHDHVELAAGGHLLARGFEPTLELLLRLGATPAQIGSWMWALGLGIGVTSIALSLRYRVPVVTAWSTPGAAMLITSVAGVSMQQAVGAFLVAASLITVCGFTGWFERALNRIPMSIASGMLAGVLLRFGLDVFVAMKTQFIMIFAMFFAGINY